MPGFFRRPISPAQLARLAAPWSSKTQTTSSLWISRSCGSGGPHLSGVTNLAIENGIIGAAPSLQAESSTRGRPFTAADAVFFHDAAALDRLGSVEVDALQKMLVFNDARTHVLVANEGDSLAAGPTPETIAIANLDVKGLYMPGAFGFRVVEGATHDVATNEVPGRLIFLETNVQALPDVAFRDPERVGECHQGRSVRSEHAGRRKYGDPNDKIDARSADSEEELDRKANKPVTAVLEMNADVLGFVELENEGAAIADIGAKVNGVLDPEIHGFFSTGAVPPRAHLSKRSIERLGDDRRKSLRNASLRHGRGRGRGPARRRETLRWDVLTASDRPFGGGGGRVHFYDLDGVQGF